MLILLYFKKNSFQPKIFATNAVIVRNISQHTLPMTRSIFYILGFFFIIATLYKAGPKANFDLVDNIPFQSEMSVQDVYNSIVNREETTSQLKSDNEARVIWVDSLQKTKNVILYLHGFGASQYEAEPMHKNLAKQFGCNLLLSRFPKCGIDSEEALHNISPELFVEYGKEVIDQASKLGDNLYIMSTSTGSTISVYLAGADKRVDGLIMLSPNFGIDNPFFDFLDGPWGQQLLNFLYKDGYRHSSSDKEYAKYWTTRYKANALIALDNLVSQTMKNSIFKSIDIPYFIGYTEHDQVIDQGRIFDFANYASTAKSETQIINFKEAKQHVIGCHLTNDHWQNVQDSISGFMTNVLELEQASLQ